MKRILVVVAAVVSALALNACGASCSDACDNIVKQCKPDLGGFDQTSYCNIFCAAMDGEKCTNTSDMYSCLADASSCEGMNTCPDCVK